MAGTFDALSWARKLKLTASDKALMFALCSYLDENNSCYPSQGTLADDAGMSVRTVGYKLQRFERLGLIERTSRMRAEGRGRSSDRIKVRVGFTPDQSAVSAEYSRDDQSAVPADQSATTRTTKVQRVAEELPENSQKRTRRQTADSEPTICPACECSTDRPGVRRVKRKDIVCLHEVAS
jgi:DNA-binding MarR family transcriptional regulator